MLPEGWRTAVKVRQTGASKGSTDKYFYSPDGRRFRSMPEVRRYLKLPQPKPKPRPKAPKKNTRQSSYAQGCFSGKDQFAQTPEVVWEWVRDKLGCEPFDPCPANPDYDGLSIPWKQFNYVNPPYKNIPPWLDRAVKEHAKGNSTLFLLPARTAPFWYHKYVMRASEIWFICGGIKFKGYNSRCPFGCIFVYYDATKPLGNPTIHSCEFHRETRFKDGKLI